MSKSFQDVDSLYRERMKKLTPAERLAMACRMFSTARTLAIAGLLSENPELTGLPLKKALFRRFYGRDFDPEILNKIEASLR